MVSEQNKTEEWVFGFGCSCFSSISDFFLRSLTLVGRSFFGNRTETLATQAKAAQKLNRSKNRSKKKNDV